MIVNSLIPIFALILLGYALRRLHFPAKAFWPEAERITYFLFMPALIVHNLAEADFSRLAAAPMAVALILGIVTISGLFLAARPLLGLDGPAFSSVFQGGVRMNSYVGLAAAAALLGPEGLTLSAVAIMGMIPITNLICVPVVAHFGDNGSIGLRDNLVELAKNPLILACLTGFGLNLCPVLPHCLLDVLALAGRVSLPLGLLAVGAALEFTGARAQLRGVALSAAGKFLVLPLLVTGLCVLFGVTGPARTVAVLFASLPTASTAFILARLLGGDTALMATVITALTLLSFATLPLALSVLG